jgi:hypothetical protein
MDYFPCLPPEIYQQILYFLDPNEVIESYGTNKYTLTIYDEVFYQEYIKRNFNLSFNGMQNNLTYKQLLYILVNGRTFSCETRDISCGDIIKINVKIHFEDTLKDIYSNINKSIRQKSKYSFLFRAVIMGKIEDKNVALIPHWHAGHITDVPILTESTTIATEFMTKFDYIYGNPLLPATLLINEISSDKLFYFNILKIWVYTMATY